MKLLRALASAPLLLSAALMILAPSACSGDDCTTLCNNAQAGNCTSIKGDCGAFCAALDNTEEPAGCTAQREAYEDCLNENSDVCVNNCDSQESALTDCMGPYCLTGAGAGSADCQTLISSLL